MSVPRILSVIRGAYGLILKQSEFQVSPLFGDCPGNLSGLPNYISNSKIWQNKKQMVVT